MPAGGDSQREATYWRALLTRVAEDMERSAMVETDPKRKRWLSGRAMRIRQRLHEGVREGWTPGLYYLPPGASAARAAVRRADPFVCHKLRTIVYDEAQAASLRRVIDS